MDKTGDVSQDVNICCLYWVGDFRGRDFNENDVLRLRQTVSKYIDRPYTFYCLTNDMNANIPAKKIALKNNWSGWWSKMELHRSDLPSGRTLYLDLDTHIVKSLKPILDYPGNLVMFPNFVKIKKRPGTVYKYQAATMLFDPGLFTSLYELFENNANLFMEKYRSDQDFMGDFIPLQPTFPKKWMCKLSSCYKTNSVDKEVIIVTGQPKIDKRKTKHELKKNLFRAMPQELSWLEKLARG